MTITLPAWLALAIAILAALGVYDRVMRPSWRWLLRSRANRVLDEVAGRLKIEVRPFQRTRRQALIDVLVYDAKVQEAAAAQAAAQNMPRALATQKVREYATEIVPAFNAYFYFRIGYWLARRTAEALYRVRIGYIDDAGLARVPPTATVVFVMNHRSNMDYVVAAYLAADRAALSYAVGEWARIWPLQQLIRAMGGYFVRRGSGDDLYRRVLERYIAMATENGVTQAVYPEGRLTRDGRMGEPRLGVLDYMLRGFDPHADRDVVFIPLGINYDRTLEDRTLLLAQEPCGPRPGALRAAWTTLRFAGQQLALMVRSRWKRFGYACVNVGTPVSVREWAAARDLDFRRLSKEDRFARVGELGTPSDGRDRTARPGAAGPARRDGVRAQSGPRTVGAGDQGRGRAADRGAGGARRENLRPARRPGLRHLGRPGDAAAPPCRRRGGRLVFRAAGGVAPDCVLRELDRAPPARISRASSGRLRR